MWSWQSSHEYPSKVGVDFYLFGEDFQRFA
jgi:hypothetical protein